MWSECVEEVVSEDLSVSTVVMSLNGIEIGRSQGAKEGGSHRKRKEIDTKSAPTRIQILSSLLLRITPHSRHSPNQTPLHHPR